MHDRHKHIDCEPYTPQYSYYEYALSTGSSFAN